ncbi:MAG: lytic murein transglycosylase B [Gammaproteobacteria bacterium]
MALSSACELSQAKPTPATYAANPDTQAFIGEMVARHGFNSSELDKQFSQAQRRDDILELMSKPAEKRLRWFEYRKIFLTQDRIDGGIAYWNENAEILDRAAASFGVDPQIIVAIIGVETRYGRITGRHRVLDALSTLAFDYPPRSTFFRKELEQYLLLWQEEDIDLLATKGSYAGAMGYGQFIPSSYRAYSVDFDLDGKRDLWNSPDDIIGSVANYFRAHGWEAGGPVAIPASVSGDKYQAILALGYKPGTMLGIMRQNGILPAKSLPDSLPGSLLSFDQKDGPEYWVGLNNFYVITRYNHSPLYAMAVYQLSERIREAYEQNTQNLLD